MSDFDSIQLRNALGSYATGVTIITTIDQQSSPVAMTANSFSSVSLDPPLILWSIDRNSRSFDIFSTAEFFAVHILSQPQAHLSTLFAKKIEDKFDQVQWHRGLNDIPIINEHLSCFQCHTKYTYDGGDHIIIVGEVLKFDDHSASQEPLIFYHGRYRNLDASTD